MAESLVISVQEDWEWCTTSYPVLPVEFSILKKDGFDKFARELQTHKIIADPELKLLETDRPIDGSSWERIEAYLRLNSVVMRGQGTNQTALTSSNLPTRSMDTIPSIFEGAGYKALAGLFRHHLCHTGRWDTLYWAYFLNPLVLLTRQSGDKRASYTRSVVENLPQNLKASVHRYEQRAIDQIVGVWFSCGLLKELGYTHAANALLGDDVRSLGGVHLVTRLKSRLPDVLSAMNRDFLHTPSRSEMEDCSGQKISEGYVFELAGDVWRVVFEGRGEFMIKNRLGARYIQWFLHNPNEVVPCLELEQMITYEKESARARNSIYPETDELAKKQMLKALTEKRREEEKLRNSGRETEAAELQEEIGMLERRVNERNCDTSNSRERARNNVRKAVGRVIQTLQKGRVAEKAFGKYLQAGICYGYEVQFTEPRGKIWK